MFSDFSHLLYKKTFNLITKKIKISNIKKSETVKKNQIMKCNLKLKFYVKPLTFHFSYSQLALEPGNGLARFYRCLSAREIAIPT